MSLVLALRIALRHLRSRTRQTILSVLGIVVGGSVFALMVAVTAGQQSFLRERLVDVSAHILVTSDRLHPVVSQNLLGGDTLHLVELRNNLPPTMRRELKPYTENIARLEGLGSEIVAVAPYVSMQGVFRNGTRYQTVTVRGVDPLREKHIARLAENIRSGKLEELARIPNGAVLGQGLAAKLRVGRGDEFRFVTPSGAVQPLRVVAIFESGVAGIDDHRGYINLQLAQSLSQMQRNAVSGLSVQTHNPDNVAHVRDLVEKATGYRAETWEETNRQVLEFQQRQKMTTQILVVIVFVTAAFGISNTLVAIVLRKRQDIAVMKGFGVTRSGISKIFLLEGLIIGLVGGAIAAIAGYGLATLFADLSLFPQNNPNAYIRFDRFPVSLDPAIYFITFGLSVVMAVAASFLPARRAARLAPVRLLREGR